MVEDAYDRRSKDFFRAKPYPGYIVMGDFPKVSCIIATHNRPHMVTEAVASVLNDPYPNLEVLVVDDGSEAEAWQHIEKKLQNVSRVQLIRLSQAVGASKARNEGLERAEGSFVTFMDDDDLNVAGKIAGQMDKAMEHGADFVTCTRFYYETGSRVRTKGRFRDRLYVNDLWRRNEIVSVTPLVKKKLMLDVKFDECLPASNDYDAWVRCLSFCKKTINYNNPCIFHRRTAAKSLTGSRKKKFIGRLRFFRKHNNKMPFFYKIKFIIVTLLKIVIPDPKSIYYSCIDRIKGT